MYLFYSILLLNVIFADYGGGYAGSGLRYSSNAREFSLSGATITDKTPGFIAFSNPALLAFVRKKYIGISIQKMSLDRSIQSLSLETRLPPNAGLSLAILRSGTNNIIGRDSNNGVISESFSFQEVEGIISFGISIGINLSLGINIKALFPSFHNLKNINASGNGISSDLGLIYRINSRFLIGALIKNQYASYNWKILLGQDEKSNKEILPKNYIIGMSYTCFKNANIYIQEDIMISPKNDVNYRMRIGTEYKLQNRMRLRAGILQTTGAIQNNINSSITNFKPTFGLGTPIKVWNKYYITLDYALDTGNVGEGLSHLFSFSLNY